MPLADSAPACPFCDPPNDRIFAEDELSVCLWDGYPVSPGHALIIPRRHVVNWFEATSVEQVALVSRLSVAKAIIDKRHQPDGYNIGINSGAAAGQTVFHLHIHLIPRYAGDSTDPRGGVRHVIPAKANYAGASEPASPAEARHGHVSPNPGPTAEEQIAFLGKIERLLSEGQFVATYKYALLIALADLAVKFGSDDGSELDLPIRAIAEEFIALYWRQGAPYGGAVTDGDYNILRQNSGRQAAILATVAKLRQTHGTLPRARQSSTWSTAVSETVRLVTEMPLWRLQRLRNEILDFLYVESPTVGHIRLKAGVTANLRRFHGMIVRLAQAEWMHFIQALPGNSQLLGPTSDLGQFLFGADRTVLLRMVAPLADVQNGLCLYCERNVVRGEVDHFVPWSRYSRDLAHNLVLAHRECNRYKSDLLAAESHLDRWLARNHDHANAIAEAGRSANIIIDPAGTRSVASWAYAHGSSLRAATWIRGEEVERLSGRWRDLLG